MTKMTARPGHGYGATRARLVRVVLAGVLFPGAVPGAGVLPGVFPGAGAGMAWGDDVDSAHVPAGYTRTFTANFDDEAEAFGPTHPHFTTGHFRLSGANDLNTTRRLADNRELQLYVDRDFAYAGQKLGIDPFSVEGGVLRITATRLTEAQKALLSPLGNAAAPPPPPPPEATPPPEPPPESPPPPEYASGLLSTEMQGRGGKGYVQSRGYWEMRAKLPAGRGLWPAFWLVTHTHDYWDEVDIFEVLGHEPDAVYHSTHFHDGGGTDGLPWEERISRGIDTSDGFHVYGLEITDAELIYSIDGEETLRVPHTLEAPLYTIINLAVGGEWPGNPDETTRFPAVMEVDYLRIYERRAEGE